MNKNKLGELDIDEFRELVRDVVRNSPKDYFVAEVRSAVIDILGQEHPDQHQFVQMLMEERAEKLRRRKALEDKIAGSLILSSILVVITLLGAGAMDWLRANLK